MMRLCALWAVAATLASAESSADRGKRVVMEAVAALGGERFANLKDRTEIGTAYSLYRGRVSGRSPAKIYTRYLALEDSGGQRQQERQVFGKKDDSAVIFARGEGWEITFHGARPLPQETLNRYKDSVLHNIFYILRVRLDEPGIQFDSLGADVIDNMPVEIVEITDSENRTVKVFFHKSTKLPLRQVYNRRDPLTKDRIEERTLYSKYREVDGIQWPFSIQRERNGETVYEIFSDQVRFNTGLADNQFTVPDGVKKLKGEN